MFEQSYLLPWENVKLEPSVWMTSTKVASLGSRRRLRGLPEKKGSAGSRPIKYEIKRIDTKITPEVNQFKSKQERRNIQTLKKKNSVSNEIYIHAYLWFYQSSLRSVLLDQPPVHRGCVRWHGRPRAWRGRGLVYTSAMQPVRRQPRIRYLPPVHRAI